jgi:hypothetical protein
VASAQLLPYDFLLRRLREQYSPDYFRNVDEREAKFREDLRWVLPIRRVYFADKPIVRRDKGKTATDVDALALVKRTGTLGVFQLKWQDPYGGDLRERRSRLTNLVPSANKWLQAAISRWSNSAPSTRRPAPAATPCGTSRKCAPTGGLISEVEAKTARTAERLARKRETGTPPGMATAPPCQPKTALFA